MASSRVALYSRLYLLRAAGTPEKGKTFLHCIAYGSRGTQNLSFIKGPGAGFGHTLKSSQDFSKIDVVEFVVEYLFEKLMITAIFLQSFSGFAQVHFSSLSIVPSLYRKAAGAAALRSFPKAYYACRLCE